MDKLTIEEKAKAYDEAIKRVENIKTGKCKTTFIFTENLFEHIFPELKESEDKKTKRLLHTIANKMSQHLRDIFTEEEFQCFNAWSNAWLEKQGEQKPAVIIPKFRVGDTIRIKNSDAEYTITEISDGYYRGRGWCLDIAAGDKCGDYELVEQKS